MMNLEKELSTICVKLDNIAPFCHWEKVTPPFRAYHFRDEYRKLLNRANEIELMLGV